MSSLNKLEREVLLPRARLIRFYYIRPQWANEETLFGVPNIPLRWSLFRAIARILIYAIFPFVSRSSLCNSDLWLGISNAMWKAYTLYSIFVATNWFSLTILLTFFICVLQDAENKKSEKKEVIGPPLQTASVSVRALIEEKIIQKRTTGKTRDHSYVNTCYQLYLHLASANAML